jgi:hypothetical protein
MISWPVRPYRWRHRDNAGFLFAQVRQTLATIALLSTVDRLEYVFVSSFAAFAVLVALTSPVHATPRWRSRLRAPLVAGTLVFAICVLLRTVLKFVASL